MQKRNKKSKKVKIMATVGPSSFDESIIRKMDLSGIDVFRVNMSHTNIEDLRDILSSLRKWTSKEICIDTEGSQIRTGMIKENNIEVKSHRIIEFVPVYVKGDLNKIPLSANPWEVLLPGDVLKIDFHSAIIQIIKSDDNIVLGRVLEGGIIGSNKGICIDRDIKLPGFTSKDIKSFAIAIELGIRIIALSFASSAKDVICLRKYFDDEIKVISKIESIQGINHLESICKESDAILIDRGDLSSEVPIEKISFAQRHIQKKANEFQTPVYVATNLLESMVNNCKPTRAEINDITSTLFSGVDGLVLAAESAIGKFPVESTRMIARIINEVENNFVQMDDVNYFCSLPTDRIIEPHGGELVQNFFRDFDYKNLKGLPSLEVDDEILSDTVKIAEGTYSPLNCFYELRRTDVGFG